MIPAESFQRKTCESPWHDPSDGLFAKPSEPDHFPYDLTGDRNVPLWLIQSLSKAAIVSVKKKRRNWRAWRSSDSVERLAEGARAELEDRKRLLRGGVICEEFQPVASSFYYEYKSVDEVWERSV